MQKPRALALDRRHRDRESHELRSRRLTEPRVRPRRCGDDV